MVLPFSLSKVHGVLLRMVLIHRIAHRIYFFVTPIEWVIGNKGAMPLAKRLTTWEGNGIKPLTIPLLGTGFNPAYQLSDLPFQSELTPAGRAAQNQNSF